MQYGSRLVDAEVLEDRGPLGVGGDRVLRVGWTPSGSEERLEFEVRASEVRPRGVDFEHAVRELLLRLPVQIDNDPPRRGNWRPDILLTLPDGGVVLVEAKAFPEGAAPRVRGEVERRLLGALEAYGASEAVLVVPFLDRFLVRREQRPHISVVPVGELEEWLAEKGVAA